MKSHPTILGLALGLSGVLGVSCTSLPTRDAKAEYIPRNLGDAHRRLRQILSPQEISHIRALKSESDMIDYHFSLGLWMRNNWGLGGGSRLDRYFRRLGVHHADDMSGTILASFWCGLHQQRYPLHEKIAEYQEYWRSVATPTGGSPKDGAKIEWVISKPGDSEPGPVHLGISASDQSYWRYAYGSHRGIEPANAADRKDLDDLRKLWKTLGSRRKDAR